MEEDRGNDDSEEEEEVEFEDHEESESDQDESGSDDGAEIHRNRSDELRTRHIINRSEDEENVPLYLRVNQKKLDNEIAANHNGRTRKIKKTKSR